MPDVNELANKEKTNYVIANFKGFDQSLENMHATSQTSLLPKKAAQLPNLKGATKLSCKLGNQKNIARRTFAKSSWSNGQQKLLYY